MTDYEREFRASPNVCGEPFAEFVRFFDDAPAGLRVLDLGCGQRRDALMAARRGHVVHGVDRSATGVQQLLEVARAERLEVSGEVGDVEAFKLAGTVDVVVLDRVMHMLPTPEARARVLERAKSWVGPRGVVLVADTRSNRALVREAFDSGWSVFVARGDFTFARRDDLQVGGS